MAAKASDKLAEIFQPQEFLYSDEEDDTTAKVASLEDDHEEDGPQLKRSSLRVQNVSMLDDVDERYSGTKVSRRSLKGEAEEDDDDVEEIDIDEEEIGGEEDSEEESEDEDVVSDVEVEDDEEIGSENSDAEEEDGSEDENDMSGDDDNAKSSEEETDVLANLSGRDTKEEIVKGKATQNQLKIFDALLETRIRLQKILIESNKLPQGEIYKSILIHKLEAEPSCNAAPCQSSLRLLLDNLMQFQDVMLKSNSETRKAMSKKRKQKQMADENDDLEDELDDDDDTEDAEAAPKKRTRNEDYATEIGTQYNNFTKFRNDTIHKWNEKTQTLSKNFSSFKTPILKQVEHILKDKDRLVKRTQTKRSEYNIIGAPDASVAEDTTSFEEIYDDDDFYHQLLRELIERKTTDVTEPSQLSRHWLELQKLRSKMKRKIDTKASKGRRIRYEVHSKLVNFMAPYDACPLTDNAMNELFGSLFGGGKVN